MANLASDEWMEIYYALQTKRKLVDEGNYDESPDDPERGRWVAVLDSILKKIGPDGTKMWDSSDSLSGDQDQELNYAVREAMFESSRDDVNEFVDGYIESLNFEEKLAYLNSKEIAELSFDPRDPTGKAEVDDDGSEAP